MPQAIDAALSGVLNSPDLTVMAQAIGVDEVDPTGQFMYPTYFPTVPADGIDIASMTGTDSRPTATRREWDGHGKEIVMETPSITKLTLTPIESRNGIGEEELHRINSIVRGNAALFAEQAALRIPERIGELVKANFRRVEVDAANVWATGAIPQKNPTNGDVYSTSLGFAVGRLQTASPGWTLATAYNNFVAWLIEGQAEVGALAGAMMGRADYNAIRAGAPNILDYGAQGITPGRAAIEARIQDDIGGAFRFVINETQVDIYDDGGSAKTRTRVWPASVIAAIPAGIAVGNTHQAPVVKAYDFLSTHPTLDVRGMVVTNNEENKGKYADLQCQANWISLPAEQNVWTINTGVTSATT